MTQTVEFLRSQILTGRALLCQAGEFEKPLDFHRDYARWMQSSVTVLKHADLDSHVRMIEQQDADTSESPYTIARITGWLESAVECLEGGLIGRLKHLLNAEMLGELVPQARQLLRAGHILPAAVLGRIAIERWVHDQAEAAGMADHAEEKVNKLNDALKAAGKITQPQWRLLQHHFDIGNAAAHGKIDQITELDVTRMLDYIETHCAK